MGFRGETGPREGDSLRFADPEGLEHELVVAAVGVQPLIADHPEIPGELALQGFHAARAYSGEPGREVAGTVHHIAWASQMDEHTDLRERALAAGARATPVIDRFWFRSIYFREPSGVLFEVATLGPGFGVDEDPERLGEELILPPFLEDQREQIEAALTPVVNPRTAARSSS